MYAFYIVCHLVTNQIGNKTDSLVLLDEVFISGNQLGPIEVSKPEIVNCSTHFMFVCLVSQFCHRYIFLPP